MLSQPVPWLTRPVAAPAKALSTTEAPMVQTNSPNHGTQFRSTGRSIASTQFTDDQRGAMTRQQAASAGGHHRTRQALSTGAASTRSRPAATRNRNSRKTSASDLSRVHVGGHQDLPAGMKQRSRADSHVSWRRISQRSAASAIGSADTRRKKSGTPRASERCASARSREQGACADRPVRTRLRPRRSFDRPRRLHCHQSNTDQQISLRNR
jgi:hypothetical protein